MISLLTNAKSIAAVGLVVAALAGGVYVKVLRSSLADVRVDLRDARQDVETYRVAAERAVQDAEALIRSRDAAASDYRQALDRIASAEGQCLDQSLPPGLLD